MSVQKTCQHDIVSVLCCVSACLLAVYVVLVRVCLLHAQERTNTHTCSHLHKNSHMHTSANTKCKHMDTKQRQHITQNKHDDNDACLFYHKSVGREIDLQHDTCSHVYYNFVCF